MKIFSIILPIAITSFVLFSQQKEENNYYIKKIIQESVEKAEQEREKNKQIVLPILSPKSIIIYSTQSGFRNRETDLINEE